MIKQIVLQNRSYRRYDSSHTISEQQLLDLIELARLSPCAANLQNLRFLPLWLPEDLDAVFPMLKWAGYLRYWDGPVPGERPTGYIVILSPENTTQYHQVDVGIAAQTMLLGATEAGLGGCMLASVDRDALHEHFQLPDDLAVVLVIAIGKPCETVVLEPVTDPDDIEYWRDDEGVHHVPKRSLRDILVPR
jgi:nitroreductase